MYRLGGAFDADGVSNVRTHVNTLDAAGGRATITVTSTFGQVDVYGVYGELNQTFPRYKATETMELRFSEGSWHLLSWENA